jgi:pimeloyl-ACP methyl ester carboxylesterase
MKQCLVILVHGWCCDHESWREQQRLFQGTGIAVDLADHGILSQTVGTLAHKTIDAFAETVVTVVDDQGADNFVLVGHSMGGAVAIEAAIRLGERCRLVVGVDTFTDVNFYARRPRDEIDRRKAEFAADFAGAINGMLDRIILKSPEPGLRDWIAGRMANVDVPSALVALDSLLDWDAAERWAHLRMPVETINSAALARPRTTQELPGLVVTEMAGVGHFPMLEDPEVFNRHLAHILARHELMP